MDSGGWTSVILNSLRILKFTHVLLATADAFKTCVVVTMIFVALHISMVHLINSVTVTEKVTLGLQ